MYSRLRHATCFLRFHAPSAALAATALLSSSLSSDSPPCASHSTSTLPVHAAMARQGGDVPSTTLIAAHVFFRHGARTALHPFHVHDSATVEHEIQVAPRLEGLPIVDIRTSTPLQLPSTSTDAGMLTSTGVQQMKALGVALALEYADLKPIYLRSTPTTRTVESAAHVASGFKSDLKIHATHANVESLFPHTSLCPTLAAVFASGRNGYMHSSSREKEAVAALAFKSHLDLNCITLADGLRSRAAHGLPVPEPWNRLEAQRALDVCALQQLEAYIAGADVGLQLAIGRALDEVAQRLLQVAAADQVAHGLEPSYTHAAAQRYFPPTSTPPALCLYSVHDSTLIPICRALDVPVDTWPPFASHLHIQLHRSDGTDTNDSTITDTPADAATVTNTDTTITPTTTDAAAPTPTDTATGDADAMITAAAHTDDDATPPPPAPPAAAPPPPPTTDDLDAALSLASALQLMDAAAAHNSRLAASIASSTANVEELQLQVALALARLAAGESATSSTLAQVHALRGTTDALSSALAALTGQVTSSSHRLHELASSSERWMKACVASTQAAVAAAAEHTRALATPDDKLAAALQDVSARLTRVEDVAAHAAREQDVATRVARVEAAVESAVSLVTHAAQRALQASETAAAAVASARDSVTHLAPAAADSSNTGAAMATAVRALDSATAAMTAAIARVEASDAATSTAVGVAEALRDIAHARALALGVVKETSDAIVEAHSNMTSVLMAAERDKARAAGETTSTMRAAAEMKRVAEAEVVALHEAMGARVDNVVSAHDRALSARLTANMDALLSTLSQRMAARVDDALDGLAQRVAAAADAALSHTRAHVDDVVAQAKADVDAATLFAADARRDAAGVAIAADEALTAAAARVASAHIDADATLRSLDDMVAAAREAAGEEVQKALDAVNEAVRWAQAETQVAFETAQALSTLAMEEAIAAQEQAAAVREQAAADAQDAAEASAHVRAARAAAAIAAEHTAFAQQKAASAQQAALVAQEHAAALVAAAAAQLEALPVQSAPAVEVLSAPIVSAHAAMPAADAAPASMGTAPVEAAPVDTAPVDTAPVAPSDATPAVSLPVDVTPVAVPAAEVTGEDAYARVLSHGRSTSPAHPPAAAAPAGESASHAMPQHPASVGESAYVWVPHTHGGQKLPAVDTYSHIVPLPREAADSDAPAPADAAYTYSPRLGGAASGPAVAYTLSPVSSASPRYFVRVKLNGNVLPVPGADSNGMVPLDDFLALLRRHIPTDYAKQCGWKGPLPPLTPHMPVGAGGGEDGDSSFSDDVGFDTLPPVATPTPTQDATSKQE